MRAAAGRMPAWKAPCAWCREHAIDLADIAKITVAASESTVRLGTRLPSTTEEAQFNQAWPLAAMLVDGEIGPAQTLEAAPVRSPDP